MTESSNTATSNVSRSDALKFGLALAAASLFGTRKAMAQAGDGAMAVAFKTWVDQTYNKNAGIINGGIKNINEWTAKAKEISNIADTARATVNWANDISNRFHGFGKNPLGSTLPIIDIASSPMMKHLSAIEEVFSKLTQAKEYKPEDPRAQKLSRTLRAETTYALNKEHIIQNRNLLTAQKKAHSGFEKLGPSGVSHAERFTKESGPVIAEAVQSIAESANGIFAILLDFHRKEFGEGQIPSKFDVKSAQKAKKDYNQGKGALPQDE
jgi:hypothetical protein